MNKWILRSISGGLAICLAADPVVAGLATSLRGTSNFHAIRSNSSLCASQALFLPNIFNRFNPFSQKASESIYRETFRVSLSARSFPVRKVIAPAEQKHSVLSSLQPSAGAVALLYPAANLVYKALHRGKFLSRTQWIEEWAPHWEETIFALILPVGAVLGIRFLPDMGNPLFSALLGVAGAYLSGAALFSLAHLFGVYRLDTITEEWVADRATWRDLKDFFRAGLSFRWFSVVIAALALIFVSGMQLDSGMTAFLASHHMGTFFQTVAAAGTGALGGAYLWAVPKHIDYNWKSRSIPGRAAAASADGGETSAAELTDLATWLFKNAKPGLFSSGSEYQLVVYPDALSLYDPYNRRYVEIPKNPTAIKLFAKSGISAASFFPATWQSAEDAVGWLRELTVWRSHVEILQAKGRPYAEWIYEQIKPTGFHPIHPTQIRIYAYYMIVQNQAPFGHFRRCEVASELAQAFLDSGLNHLELPARDWNSAQEVLEYLLSLLDAKLLETKKIRLNLVPPPPSVQKDRLADWWSPFERGSVEDARVAALRMAEVLAGPNSSDYFSLTEALGYPWQPEQYLTKLPWQDFLPLVNLNWQGISENSQKLRRSQLLSLIRAYGNIHRVLLNRMAAGSIPQEGIAGAELLSRTLSRILGTFARDNRDGTGDPALAELARNLQLSEELGLGFNAKIWSDGIYGLFDDRLTQAFQKGNVDANVFAPLAEATSFLAHFPNELVRFYWNSLIDQTLNRLKTDPRLLKQDAWAFTQGPGPYLFKAWKRLEAQGPDELREIFYGCWARAALQKDSRGQFHYLDSFLDLAGRDWAIAPRILALLTVVSEVSDWKLDENYNPWSMIEFALNLSRLTLRKGFDDVDLVRFKRLFNQNYNTASMEKGLAKFSDIREISKSDIDFGGKLYADVCDLNRFIHREIHHGLAEYTVALVESRFLFEWTGNLGPALALCKKYGEKVTKSWRKNMNARLQRKEVFKADPVLAALFQNLSRQLHSEAQIEWLAVLSPDQLMALRKQLEEDEVLQTQKLRIAEVFDREIPVYQWLFRRFKVDRLTQASESLRASPKFGAWPTDPTGLILAEDGQHPAGEVLDRIIGVRSRLERHLAGNPQHTLFVDNPGYEQSHGYWSYRGLNLADPVFLAYQMDEFVRLIEMETIRKCEEELKSVVGNRYLRQSARLLSQLISILDLTGMKSQRLQQLQELLTSETLTAARLEHLCLKINGVLQSWTRRMDREYGPWINAVASQVEFRDVKRDILTGMAASVPGSFTLVRGNMRTYLESRMLRENWPQFRLMGVVTDILARVEHFEQNEKSGTPSQTAKPIFFGIGEQIPALSIERGSEKGTNLARMSNQGLPIPPGFMYAIGTPVFDIISNAPRDIRFLEGGIEEVGLTPELGEEFGSSSMPLLISVRSAALFDAPGQLASVTNVGITPENLPALAERIGWWGAWDSYRRFLQEYAMTVLGMDRAVFTDIIEEFKAEVGVETKTELSSGQMADLAKRYERRIKDQYGQSSIPDDVHEQADRVIRAVHRSWNSEKVRTYRRREKMLNEKSPAVIIQAMVHGNYSKDIEIPSSTKLSTSGAGVAKSSLLPWEGPNGSFAALSEGFDIADGVVTAEELNVVKIALPDIYKELSQILSSLSHESGSNVHLEYTIQKGKLWILQERLAPDQGMPLLFRKLSLERNRPVADGYGLCGDAAKGPLIMMDKLRRDSRHYDPDLVLTLRKQVEEMRRKESADVLGHVGLIVVTNEATPELAQYLWPEDGVAGFIAKVGSRHSHQEELATQLGLTAVAGLDAGTLGSTLEIDPTSGRINFSPDLKVDFKEGDVVSLVVEGGEGKVYPGGLPFADSHPFAIPSWRDVRSAIKDELSAYSAIPRWFYGPLLTTKMFAAYLLRFAFIWAYDAKDWRQIRVAVTEAWTKGIYLGFHNSIGQISFRAGLEAPKNRNLARRYLHAHEEGLTESDGLRLGREASPFFGRLADWSAEIVKRAAPSPTTPWALRRNLVAA